MLVVTVAAVAVAHAADARSGGTAAGKIAFIRAGASFPHHDIYVMRGDGTRVRRVTSAFQWRSAPVWSPDGRRILYEVLAPDAEMGVWLIRADGTGSRRLTGGQEPTWAPTGRSIAFTRWDSTGSDRSLFIARADGTRIRRLTDESCGVLGCEDGSASWAPGGQTIAFLRVQRGVETDIYTVRPNGSGLSRLTNTRTLNEERPAWSPDGTKLAYVGRVGSDVGLYVVNADGTGRRRLTRGFHVNSPTWSPDGRRIAVSSNGSVVAIDVVGGRPQVLVQNATEPTWVGRG